MLVYKKDKEQFIADVESNVIHLEIGKEVKRRIGRGTAKSEIDSWRNSMRFMKDALRLSGVPSDSNVSIEYAIPLTSKRVDFILTGRDEENREIAVIVELKQWSAVERTEKDAVVKTALGGGIRETNHPSYQAWSYARLIEDFNETVRDEHIKLRPCAYLHNLDSRDDICHEHYSPHTDLAPVFISEDVSRLAEFLHRFVKHGDKSDVMYKIDNGRIRPSKQLADSLAGMLAGNQEFLMIDEQKLVYEKALELHYKHKKNNADRKQVLIIEGGPGTGKSVVAINLLSHFTSDGAVTQYVTKNQAPRDVYTEKLTGTYKKTYINNLFKGSASYTGVAANTFDVLVVDEAHRLVSKNRYNKDSENQIKELIHASKLCIFFVDDRQQIHWADVGSKSEICEWAGRLGAEITEMELASQFRCNGSNGYLDWLDHVLGIEDIAIGAISSDEYAIQVMDSPIALRDKIFELNAENNRSRMVAGYCWDWNSKKDKHAKDIAFEDYKFEAQWNRMDVKQPWLIGESSVGQIGCIHTCQGLDLDYVGVIIGPDLLVRDDQVITDAAQRSSMDASIKGYKKLLKENPDAASAKADRIIKNTYRTLMSRGQKGCFIYCEDKETREYFKSWISASKNEVAKRDNGSYEDHDLPVELVQIPPSERFVTAVPLLSLKAAAGAFSEEQYVETCDWVRLAEHFSHRPGYFVLQVVGESMNNRIPNGAWCLFKQDQGGSRNGKIVLVELRDGVDSDTGLRYTVKRYQSTKMHNQDSGQLQHQAITLSPMSNDPVFKEMVFEADENRDYRVVGEFVSLL